MAAFVKHVYLSHSKKSTMQVCGRMFKEKYILRREARAKSANLGFGSAIHSGCAAVLTGQILGVDVDPVPVFEQEWSEFTSKNAVAYSSLWSEEKLMATGRVLLQKFVEDWKTRGWTPAVDPDGNPLVELELKVKLPGNITFTAIIDAIVIDEHGRYLVLDFKTPAQAALEGFATLSDQLLGYQVAVDAFKDELGIPGVGGLVFYEMIKRPLPKTARGEGPKIHVEEPALPRSNDEVAEWIWEAQCVADDIRKERFSKRPMDSYNTPCSLCDFQKSCMGLGDADLVSKPSRFAA